MVLVDDGLVESGAGGTDLQSISITSSSPQRVRSSSFSITDDNRFYALINPLGGGTIDGMNAWVLLERSGGEAEAAVATRPSTISDIFVNIINIL